MEWTENNTSDEYIVIDSLEDLEEIYSEFCAKDRIQIYAQLLKEFEQAEDYEFCCEIRDKIKELKD